jgi:PAS domain S-box-containing protein
MQKIFSCLRVLLSPPVFDDEEKSRIARFLHIVVVTIVSVSVLVGIIDALAGVFTTAYMLSIIVLPLLVVFWVARHGRVTLASYIMVVSMVVAITVLLSVGQGIHDIGLVDYALLLIITSYLLNRKGILAVTLVLILSVAVVVFGEIYHFLPVKVTPGYFLPRPADFIIVSLTIVIGAVAISFMAGSLTSALQQARLSEVRWRSLVDHAPDIIINVDVDGKILFINRSGMDLPELYTGKSIFDSLPPEYREVSRQILARVLSGEATTQELQAYNSLGELQWYSFRIGPIRQPNGIISGAIIIATNIQDQKNSEQEIQNSKEALQLRAEQLAMLYEMGKAVTNLQSLDSLLKVVLEQMKSVLPLDVFFASLYDETTGILSFPLLYEGGKLWNEPPSLLSPNCQTDIVLRTGKPFLTNNASDEYDYWKKIGDTEKDTASIMITPLSVGQRVIGAISAQSYAPDSYNEDMLALLSGAANQIGIAIENAKLFEAAKMRADQLAALNEIGRSIATLQDLKSVLDDTFRLLGSLLSIDVFFIALYNADNKDVSFPLVIDDGRSWTEPAVGLEPGGLLEKTIIRKEPVLINRTQAEIEERRADETRLLGNRSKISASIIMSPLVAGDRVIGVISAQSYSLNAYNEDNLTLLTSASHQIAIAIENARLYEELQKELAERKRAEVEIRELNTGLEERVRARTEELETTSKELGSFTYTVSHDLRAPLRAINGFSHILIEDHGDELAAPAREHLFRIQESARYMGRLIDDLLTFTRMGRHPIRKVRINLTDIARQAFDEATRYEDLKRIEFTLRPLPVVRADPMLMEQVFANLLSNAIKFSARREIAKIDVGSQSVNGDEVFYVRDNGAGFDMSYNSKLFGMFQRLHHQTEFEGTGVGLAIAQRILQRHGGRIWAESALDVGATFYFTLDSQEKKPV